MIFAAIFISIFLIATITVSIVVKPTNKKLTNDYETITTKRSLAAILSYVAVMFIFIYIISSIFVTFWLAKNGYTTADLKNEEIYSRLATEANPLIELIIYTLVTGIVVFITYKAVLPEFKRIDIMAIVWVLVGIAGLFAVGLLSNILNVLFNMNKTSTNQAGIEEMLFSSNFGLFSTVITTTIMAPIVEELIFRKCFFSFFKGNNLAAIIISSLAFGLLHVISPAFSAFGEVLAGNAGLSAIITELFPIISYSLMGAVIGTIYVISDKNILVTILLHIVYNSISIFALLFL